ncbi:MAG: undecaprenyl/decaprenyl-phosphate alpha-N-acetylglucosaminyl 1-phosphate transferase [Planctomycetes bacterium]|nr:undecaprenyl/decaprenyl-phosphate alpha-N-acetylglucosaminyl 1-phosphate transferase [Planctomycetota bacterium]
MPAYETVIGLIAFAAGFGLIFTRIARGVASTVGLVDPPDGHRKKQTTSVPAAGGIAVLAAALLTLLIVALEDPAVAETLTANLRKSLALLAAAVLITFVGALDDRYNLRARHKLGGQLVAIFVLVIGGDFVIRSIGLFGYRVELSWFDIPFTVFWLLACVNALNLIDGMDGLLGTVGTIALVSLAIIAAMTEHLFAASVALALAGAMLGFLWWNLPPATIYMGDSGSMLIGFVIGAVAIPASLKGPAMISLGAPLAILILPVFDTAAAIIRRKLTGRGVASPDTGHMHHKMMDRGLTPPRVLTVVAGLGVFAATGALISTVWSNDLYAFVAAGGVIVALVASNLFGNAELGLIRTRVSKFGRKLLVGDVSAWGLSVRLQGSADWERIWSELTTLVGRLQLQSLCLNVNSPVLRENYHARWNNPVAVRANYILQLEIPLFGSHGTPLGQLTIAIARDARPITEAFATIGKLVETLEHRAATLTGSVAHQAPQTNAPVSVPLQTETLPI